MRIFKKKLNLSKKNNNNNLLIFNHNCNGHYAYIFLLYSNFKGVVIWNNISLLDINRINTIEVNKITNNIHGTLYKVIN